MRTSFPEGTKADPCVNLLNRPSVDPRPGILLHLAGRMEGPFRSETKAGDTISVWIVDVGGKRLVIEAETTKQGADLDHEIQQIIESIRFE